MQFPDLITIIINVSHSLVSVIYMLNGLSYLTGLVFIYIALGKLRAIADRHAQYPSHEKGHVPLTYLVVGMGLLLLPQTISILSTTTFGDNNILAYTKPRNPNNLIDAMMLFIKTAGFIWVLRGAVLIASGTQPGAKEGPKGLAFLFAGLCALNVDSTITVFNSMIAKIQAFFGPQSPG